MFDDNSIKYVCRFQSEINHWLKSNKMSLEVSVFCLKQAPFCFKIYTKSEYQNETKKSECI